MRSPTLQRQHVALCTASSGPCGQAHTADMVPTMEYRLFQCHCQLAFHHKHAPQPHDGACRRCMLFHVLQGQTVQASAATGLAGVLLLRTHNKSGLPTATVMALLHYDVFGIKFPK